MTELHPALMKLVLERLLLAGVGLGAAAQLGPDPLAWPWDRGLLLLVRWEGERFPMPSLATLAERRAIIVGAALGDAATVQEWAGVGHTADTIYHYAVAPVSAGGLLGPINPLSVQTRVCDAGGTVLGLLPNAPGGLSARLLAGRKVLVTWTYARAGEQITPSQFAVFRALNGAAFDFGTMVGSVTYARGRSHYSYVDGPLSAADVAHYTVRSAAAAGLSLIPRLRGGPSGSYSTVALDRVPAVVVPGGPPAAVPNLSAETQ